MTARPLTEQEIEKLGHLHSNRTMHLGTQLGHGCPTCFYRESNRSVQDLYNLKRYGGHICGEPYPVYEGFSSDEQRTACQCRIADQYNPIKNYFRHDV